MTQAEFARVTGLGTASLVRWENGSMNHTRANDRYIRLLESPDVMRRLRRLSEPVRPPNSVADRSRWTMASLRGYRRAAAAAEFVRPAPGGLSAMYVTTFYSFKGGVGRTMALVNVAVELAQRGRRVLAVDFDLEAPGLDTFKVFRSRKKRSGIVDFVTEYLEAGRAPAVDHFVHESKGVGEKDGCLWVMPSGEQHGRYPTSFRENRLARSVRAPRRVPPVRGSQGPVGTGRQAGLRADRLSYRPHGHGRHLYAAASGCGGNPLLSERPESPGSDHGRAGHSGGSRERSQEGDRAPLRDVERTGSGRRGPGPGEEDRCLSEGSRVHGRAAGAAPVRQPVAPEPGDIHHGSPEESTGQGVPPARSRDRQAQSGRQGRRPGLHPAGGPALARPRCGITSRR